jgi:SAM-dependent methyltransferase
MFEQSKSLQRRLHDSNFITRYFVGKGIDIGSGPDPLTQYAELFPLMASVQPWDIQHGDAQLMATCSDDEFDFVHSSHCLEHMQNPKIALQSWLRILKPGGHLIVLVPDEDMYEQGVFPSSFNVDHKWTFTVSKFKSWSARSLNLMTLLSELGPSVDIIKLEQITRSFRFGMPRCDQTITPIGEAAIEIVIRKRPPEETDIGGCLPSTRKSRVGTSVIKFGEQWIFDNLHRIRDAQIAQKNGNLPYSVVIPLATYSPWQLLPEFLAAFQSVKAHTLVDMYRCYELWCFVEQTRRIPGDVLEVGVWRGGSGCLLVLAMKAAQIQARLILADTFVGVAKAGADDFTYCGGKHADTDLATVKSLLAANRISNVEILEGIFPEQSGGK